MVPKLQVPGIKIKPMAPLRATKSKQRALPTECTTSEEDESSEELHKD